MLNRFTSYQVYVIAKVPFIALVGALESMVKPTVSGWRTFYGKIIGRTFAEISW